MLVVNKKNGFRFVPRKGQHERSTSCGPTHASQSALNLACAPAHVRISKNHVPFHLARSSPTFFSHIRGQRPNMAFLTPVTLPPRVAPVPFLHRAAPTACAAAPRTPREAYKSAKAAYKSAKRAVVPVSPAQLAQLESAYRDAKALYKQFKRAGSARPELLPEIPPSGAFTSRYPATPRYDEPAAPGVSAAPSSPASAPGGVDQVAVCAGKSCKRLGADAVAAMMKLAPPEGKCMKQCGGVGPTISVDGVPRKVNFRKALADAMHVAADQYRNN